MCSFLKSFITDSSLSDDNSIISTGVSTSKQDVSSSDSLSADASFE